MIGSIIILAATLLLRSALLGYLVALLVCFVFCNKATANERIALFFGLAFSLSYYDGFELNFGLNLGGLSYPKMLIIAILLPLFITAKPEREIYKLHSIDKAVLLFLGWTIVLGLREANLSSIMRTALWTGVEFVVPYLVIRRHLSDYRLLFAALSFALFSQALQGTAESILRWHIHTDIEWIGNWSQSVQAMYKIRWGFLRAQASFLNPLIFSLFASMAFLSAVIYFRRIGMDYKADHSRLMALGALCVTLLGNLSTVSRSGMMAAVLILLVLGVLLWAINRERDPRRMLIGFALAATTMVFTVFFDFVETNFSYRARLLELGSQVILMHPFTGQPDPTVSPLLQELVQGEGIIDLVNHYISIGLHYGLPGLLIFLYAILGSLNRLYLGLRTAEGELMTIGVFVFASLTVLAFNLVTSSAFAWTWAWIFLLLAITSNIIARLDSREKELRSIKRGRLRRGLRASKDTDDAFAG